MSRRRIGKRIALAASGALLALLAAEGGMRAWLSSRGHAYTRSGARTELAKVHAEVLGALTQSEDAGPVAQMRGVGYRLHPYLGYDLERGNEQIEGNLERLARPDPDRFTILLTGGSVAGIFGGSGMRKLRELLAADERFAGAKIVALDYGRPAYKEPQQLILVAYLIGLGLHPDLVLNLDGFNEVAVAASNAREGTSPSHPSLGQWMRVATAGATDANSLERLGELVQSRAAVLSATERVSESPLLASALYGELALRWIHAREKRYVDAVLAYTSRPPSRSAQVTLRGPEPPQDFADVLAHSVREWEEGSRSLHALCAARGIAYLHVLQPTLHDEGSKPLTDGERDRGRAQPEWVEAARQGYPLLRAAGERLRAEGVRFFDASRVFADVPEELYLDACHFDAHGNELLAEAIARELLANADLRR